MVTSTGALSSTGIGSGLDVSTIISRLMAVEAQPLTRLQTQATEFNSQLSTVGRLQSAMSTLRDKANALVSPTLWTSTTATVSDTTAMRVSTSATASAGSYAVQVNKMAAAETAVSRAFANSKATIGAGTLSIQLGGYGADLAFNPKANTAAVSVNIVEGKTSLTDVRDQINSAGAGVVASIVTDANGARLTLRSKETGAENAFQITATESAGDGEANTGLSALAYDGGKTSALMARTATGANADVLINGIAVSSPTNTLSEVVDGLTFSLTKTTSTPVVVDVASDTAAIKTAITDFVAAFNGAASFIKTQTAYNAENKTAGALQGDQSTLALQAQLRAVINEGSSASSAFGRLSDIGFSLKSDGTLDTNTVKLDSAMGNLAELKKVLNADGGTNASSGFARRFKRLADAAVGSDGMIESRNNGLRRMLDRNSKSQQDMQTRLDGVQARLQRQYSALDTTMASLNALSTYMTQQITQLNRT